MSTAPLRVNGIDLPDGSVGVSISGAGHAVIRYNNSSHQLEASINGGAFAAIGGGGGGGTQGGTTSASNIPYASGANTLSDTGWSWNNITKVLTAAAPGYRIDGDGLMLTGSTNPINIGPTTGHYLAISATALDTPGGDLDFSLGGPGNRRFRGLWNGGRLSAGYNSQSLATYTVVAEDCFVLMSNAAARTVTLYAANAVTAGTLVVIKDSAGTAATANITINRAGTDTIDGATSLIISTNYGKAGLVSNGVGAWSQVF